MSTSSYTRRYSLSGLAFVMILLTYVDRPGLILASRLLSAPGSGFSCQPWFLSAYPGQAFDPKMTHFYPHRPEAFSKILSIFIRILPQGSQWTFRGPVSVMTVQVATSMHHYYLTVIHFKFKSTYMNFSVKSSKDYTKHTKRDSSLSSAVSARVLF